VLWKQSSGDEPGWESPWGRGRPGWHIECSAMSAAYLGEVFDIHGGGIDLIFPHHENELAQSRCAHGTPAMANYWMHNEFLQIEDTKMSKSLGNFVTIRDLLADWPGDVLRLSMLKTHYRSPINWTVRGLEESSQIINSWAIAIQPHGVDPEEGVPTLPRAVVNALRDDLNTPLAITEMHGMARAAKNGDEKAGELLAGAADFLGLRRSKWDSKLEKHIFNSAFDDKVNVLIADRTAARARKDFKESDRIRDELAAIGVLLKDGKDPATGEPVTTWEIAR
jgi:cysteinyl-tRNA synthetase